MRRILFTTFLLTCVLTLTASAQYGQGPSSPSYGRSEVAGTSNTTGATVTTLDAYKEHLNASKPSPGAEVSLEGRVFEINAAANRIVVEQEKSGKLFNIPLSPKTKLRADNQTELAGRTNLNIADFKPGQFIRITYSNPDPKVIEVRLRRKKG